MSHKTLTDDNILKDYSLKNQIDSNKQINTKHSMDNRKNHKKQLDVLQKFQLQKMTKEMKDKINYRIQDISNIRHQNVFNEFQTKQHNNNLLLMWSQNKEQYLNLSDILKRKWKFQQNVAINLVLDILCGYQKLINMDIPIYIINPQKIYIIQQKEDNQVQDSQRLVAKVADFGFQKITKSEKKIRNIYYPPECVFKQSLSQKSLVWGIGIVLFQLLSGQFPWNIQKISNYQKLDIIPPNFDLLKCHPQNKNTIKRLLQINQQKRIQGKQVYELLLLQPEEQLQQPSINANTVPALKKIGLNRKVPSGMPQYYQINQYAPIAGGAFGKIYASGDYAIKMVNFQKKTDYQKRILKKQTQVQMSISHRNVVKLYQYFEQNKSIYLIMQYCETNLQSYLKKYPNLRLQEKQALVVFKQILLGYKQLLSRGIVHRDLKPENILITKQNIVKLADFGFSRFIQNQQEILSTIVGSPAYMSPQLIKSEQYSPKSDIWSLGIILYQMIFGKLPWDPNSNRDILQQPVIFPETKVQNKTKQLILQMLQKQQIDRISWEDLFLKFNIEYKGPEKKLRQSQQKLMKNTCYGDDTIQNTRENKTSAICQQLQRKPTNLSSPPTKQNKIKNNNRSNQFFQIKVNQKWIRRYLILEIKNQYRQNSLKQPLELLYKLKTCYLDDLANAQHKIIVDITQKFDPQLNKAIKLLYRQK